MSSEWLYPYNVRHGEAWRYFTAECRSRGITVPGQHSADLWPWFLAGWKAKGQQHNDLRKRR